MTNGRKTLVFGTPHGGKPHRPQAGSGPSAQYRTVMAVVSGFKRQAGMAGRHRNTFFRDGRTHAPASVAALSKSAATRPPKTAKRWSRVWPRR